MLRLWLAANALLLVGCASSDPTAYRTDPHSRTDPSLLHCAAGRVPVCRADAGRTRKRFSDCSCKLPVLGPG